MNQFKSLHTLHSQSSILKSCSRGPPTVGKQYCLETYRGYTMPGNIRVHLLTSEVTLYFDSPL